jgi:hypothetical protein
MLQQAMSRRAMVARAAGAMTASLAIGAGRPAMAQVPVTWGLGRIQFQNKSGYPLHGLRIDDQQANAQGGYVRITALNDGECAPGAGIPTQSIQQRFLFRWAFNRDVSQLTFPQEFAVQFTVEADGNVPCLDLNPIIQLTVDQARLDSSLRGARFYQRPNPFHVGGPRTVRVISPDAWPNPVFFAIGIWNFRGNRPLFLEATYPYTAAAAQPPQQIGERSAQDMLARAQRDRRFGAAIAGSAGAQLNWAPAWQLRWMDFQFSAGRRVRVYHVTSATNPAARYTIFQDPDTGQWRNWEQS